MQDLDRQRKQHMLIFLICQLLQAGMAKVAAYQQAAKAFHMSVNTVQKFIFWLHKAIGINNFCKRGERAIQDHRGLYKREIIVSEHVTKKATTWLRAKVCTACYCSRHNEIAKVRIIFCVQVHNKRYVLTASKFAAWINRYAEDTPPQTTTPEGHHKTLQQLLKRHHHKPHHDKQHHHKPHHHEQCLHQ